MHAQLPHTETCQSSVMHRRSNFNGVIADDFFLASTTIEMVVANAIVLVAFGTDVSYHGYHECPYIRCKASMIKIPEKREQPFTG